MLTKQDRAEIRIGAMRGWGQRHAEGIFWALMLPVILIALALIAAAAWVAAWLHDQWIARIGPAVDEHGAVMFVAIVFAVAAAVALLRAAFGRRRRQQHWHR
jgi:uncharacterized protein involved in cysteine biosynthesis